MAADDWNPAQYARFATERSLPFFTLASMVEVAPQPVVVDLGCGSGELTAHLHRSLGASRTTGIDSSPAMLAEAASHATESLTFERGDLAHFEGGGTVDLIFSNAALQWVDDHPSVLRRWVEGLRSGGQVAVQVPANADHPSHRLGAVVLDEEPFRSTRRGPIPVDLHAVLAPEAYAELLFDLGLTDLEVRLQVFPHVLSSSAELVEWVRATALLRYLRLVPDELHQAFIDRYRTVLLDEVGDRSPYFYPFKRILFVGRRP